MTKNYELQAFLESKRIEGKSERTIARYELVVKMMLNTIEKDVNEITTLDIRSYLSNYKQERKISDATLDGIRRCLSSFFTWCFDEQLINDNPIKRVKKIKTEKKVKEILTDEEIEKLKIAAAALRDRAILELFLSTGMRIGELVQIQINDVNFFNKEIIVHGKGNKQRKVYFNASTKIWLEKYLETRKDANPALFVSLRKRNGEYTSVTIEGVRNRINKIAKDAGVENVHPHAFRAKFATDSLKHGMPIEKVSKILGHEKLETTQIYAITSDLDCKLAYDKYVK